MCSTKNMVFERHEKKFLLSMAAYQQLRERLEPFMQQDEYGLHTISSVYYDTEDYRIIRASLAKPAYKEKLRLRSYGVPGEEEPVYLELKKKLDGVVYKRRISLSLAEARDYLGKGVKPGDQGQIFQEIDWFIGRYRPYPAILLAYDRIALFGRENKSFRVTFDFRARWREDQLDPGRGHHGQYLISPEQCLMEVKTGAALPVLFTKILADMELYPRSFSKYGACYSRYLLGKGGLRHAG